MAKIVKYNNDMNNVSFIGFKEKELDLFFSICFKMKEQGIQSVTLSFEELKSLSNYVNRNLSRFYKDLEEVYNKLLELKFRYEDDKKIERFVLFTRYLIDKEAKTVTIQINERFKYILNNLVANYTKLDLLDFVSLNSIYSKNMFKLLKQWDSICEKIYNIEVLRVNLGVPESYDTSNFNRKVLKPISTELPKYFDSLKIEKLKTGKKVTDLKFSWKRKKEALEIEEAEIIISEKLDKAIEKAKKNRFIANLFTDENIEKLLNKFEEPALIKGLNVCYKEIQKDVKSLNYLIKAIETAAGKKTKKIVVEKEKEMDQEKLKPISKEKVLESEFAEIYKHYLMINDIEDNMFTKKAFAMNYEIVDEIILPDELKKIVKKYAIDNEQVLHFMGAGSSREEAIRVIESNIIYNNRIPEEHIKEYEEFLAWKKWNEERINKK
ncbi:replication initiation protein [Fusobacterium varium]|uniref:replication initiation protein n=1 Tax=Fusobacterium varium TaxID=856 RepID=UPI001F470C4A|nr:replication initiation protein [Fusobacterium varium]MCF2673620.1 replication initiation protein [Fusobacterium varium]